MKERKIIEYIIQDKTSRTNMYRIILYKRKHGKIMAEVIHKRIDELGPTDSIEWMIEYSIGRYHALTGNKKGQYALDFQHPYRLIISKDEIAIVCVKVEKIEDYHCIFC